MRGAGCVRSRRQHEYASDAKQGIQVQWEREDDRLMLDQEALVIDHAEHACWSPQNQLRQMAPPHTAPSLERGKQRTVRQVMVGNQ
jgi:hypothetical protein